MEYLIAALLFLILIGVLGCVGLLMEIRDRLYLPFKGEVTGTVKAEPVDNEDWWKGD